VKEHKKDMGYEDLIGKAEWTRRFINDLPDAAFAHIEPGGEKDENGRTVPRSKRHFPHHGAGVKKGSEHGTVDKPHLRNALARARQSPHGSKAVPHLERHARALLATYQEEKRSVFHLEMKAVDKAQRIIEGYASVAGIEDRDGEVMTIDALKAGLDEYMLNPVILYNHGQDPEIGMNPIGQVLEHAFRGARLWVRAQIVKGDEFADRVWNLIDQGVLRAFSVGAVTDLIERAGNTITKWPIVELSVVTIPANAYSTFSVVKALTTGTDIEFRQETDQHSHDADDDQATSDAGGTEPRQAAKSAEISKSGVIEMEFDQLYEQITTKLAEDAKAEADRKAAEATRIEELAEEKAEVMFKALQEKLAKRIPGGDKMIFGNDDDPKPAPIHVLSKWDTLSLGDHAVAYMFMKQRAADRLGPPPPIEVYRSLAVKAAKHLDSKDFDIKAFSPQDIEGPAVKGLFNLRGKANELVHSTQSGYGDEWVPTLAAEELWRAIRLTARVLPLFQQFDMPSQPFDFPAESTDPTFYKQAETTAEASLSWTSAGPFKKSKIATAKVQFSAGKLGAMTVWSTEMGEDGIIAIQPQFRDQYGVKLAETIDEVLISGDETTGTTNISYAGASITTKSRFLIVDGLRHEALVTTTADGVSGATLDIGDFVTVRSLMGSAGKYAVDPSDLAYISDPGVYYKAIVLDEVLTLDQVGPAATILNGQLASVMGIPLVVPPQYPLTYTDGTIHSTGSNNTKGSFFCVRRSGVKVGWKRRPQVTVERLPGFDAYAIMATLRLDIRYFGAGMVGLSYNLTV